MASLSNINGLFDVHSTGAILFSTSHGTLGQILKSNGNAAPTWVAASTVIGGPYLPLTGGTLSGPLSGTSATFSDNIYLADDEALNFGTSNAFNLRWNSTAASGQGASIIDSNRIFIETNFFQLNSRSGTPRLTISGSTSTFAGNITTPQINLNSAGGGIIDNQTANIFIQTPASGGWIFRNGAPGYVERMRIDSSGNVGIGGLPTNYGATYKNLDVSGSNGAYLTLIGTTNTVKVDIAAETTAGYVGTKTAHPFIFRTDDVARMRIDSSGLVSLPTTGLNDTRHIIFTGTQGTTNNAGNLGMWGNEVRLTGNWYYNGAQRKVVAGNGMGVMGIATGTTDATCYLTFGVNGPAATGGPTERMRIHDGGSITMGEFNSTNAPNNGILKIKTGGSTAGTCYPLLSIMGSTHLATRQYGIGMDPEGYSNRVKMFFGVDGMGNGYSYGDFVWNINTQVGNDIVSPTDERMRLDKGGDLKLKTGNLAITNTSKGILLGGTGTANQLRIYQHGTWAPQIYYQNATDQANATNSTQVGLYTRIGNICMVQFRLVWNQASGTPAVDNIGIKNLPFQGSTTNTYAEVPCFIKNYTGGPSPRGNLTLTLPGANSPIALFNDTNFVGNMGNAIGSGTKEIRFSFTYTTNG